MVTTETVSPAPPPSVNGALFGPNPASVPSRNPFGFFKGKAAKIVLLILLILVPVTVFVAINYKTFFKPQAEGVCTAPSGKIGDDGPGGCCNNYNDTCTSGDCREWEVCNIPNGACASGSSCRSLQGCSQDSDCGPNKACVNGNCNVSGNIQCTATKNGTVVENKTGMALTDCSADSFSCFVPRSTQVACTNGCGGAPTTTLFNLAIGASRTFPGADGQCGSWQTDLEVTCRSDTQTYKCVRAASGCDWGAGCNVVPPPPPPPPPGSPSCTGLTLSPTSTVITTANEARTFTVTATGGTPPYTTTWVTNNGATITKGTPSTTAAWRAPTTLPTTATTWTITPTVKDSANQTLSANAACVKTLTFTPGGTTPPPPPPPTPSPSPSPTPPPPPPSGSPSHMVCQNYACVSVSGSGTNECTNNESCLPPKVGTSWPTVVGVGAGFVLTLLGALLLL